MPEPTRPPPRSYRLLVVDDNDGLREILVNAVAAYGHRIVAEAADGAEAVERFREVRPDAVLLDVQMPVADGWQALAGILAVDPAAVVIMVTSEEGAAVEARCAELGARGYIKKPFGMDRLQREIKVLLEVDRLRARGTAVSRDYIEHWVKPRVSFPHKVDGDD